MSTSSAIKGTRRVMLSSSWFSPEEEAFLAEVQREAAKNDSISDLSWCLNADGQWGETDVTEHPEVAKDITWKTRTFLNDVTCVKAQDCILLAMVPGHEDTGAVAEAAMAYAWGKPVVLVLPDYAMSDKADTKINLMPAMLADTCIGISDLADFDFNHIRNNPYPGMVY